MKKIGKLLIVILILSLCSSPVFGGQESLYGADIQTVNQQNLILTDQISRVMIQPRGEVVSMATIAISNEGRGVIGVMATTLCHMEVDRITTRIILDRYNEKTGSWGSVDIYEFDYSAEDYPNEIFSDAIISFDITDKPAGYYYRLRGLHAVWKDGESQGYGTLTDGILITDY